MEFDFDNESYDSEFQGVAFEYFHSHFSVDCLKLMQVIVAEFKILNDDFVTMSI